MAENTLESYIERSLKKGRSPSDVRNRLLKAGYKVESIEQAMRNIRLSKPEIVHLRTKYIAGISILLAVISILVLVFSFEKGEDFVEYKENITFSQMSDVELLLYAEANDNIEVCKYVRDENRYYACKEKSWLDEGCMFELLTGENIDLCYYNDAVSSLDFNLCGFIVDDYLEDNCINEIIDKKGVIDDPSLCEGNYVCFSRLLDSFGFYYDLCESIPEGGMRNACFFNLSIDKNDKNLCAKIKNSLKAECVDNFKRDFSEIVDDCISLGIYENFLINYGEEGGFENMSIEDSAKLHCFVESATIGIAKGFYSCEEMLSFTDMQSGVYAYLDHTKEMYSSFAVYEYEDNESAVMDEDNPVYRCVQ